MNQRASKEKAATELKIALDNRAFEIQLFWQRSNYFLVLMTALGVATFSIKDLLFGTIMSIFTTFSSYFWFRTNLGSKFWQESWEVEVSLLAIEQNIRSFERSNADVVDQVRESLESSSYKSSLRRWIDKKITEKYSVTYNMILLSLFSTLVWFFVMCTFIYRLFDVNFEENLGCFICTTSPSPPTTPLPHPQASPGSG